MKITIKATDFKLQPKLSDFIMANVKKLCSVSDRIMSGHVVLKLEKSDVKQNKICELKLVVPGNDLFAIKRSDTFQGAVLESTEAIRYQVERWKNLKGL